MNKKTELTRIEQPTSHSFLSILMSKGKKGLSLLHVYARSNNVAEMIKLINNKENVNAKDSRKRY